MRSVPKFLVLAGLIAALACGAMAQEKGSVVKAASSKFGPLPNLPACLTLSAQRGDPTQGAAVILAKAMTGCKVPWHWHTASEGLMIVSGRARIEMKDGPASSVSAGDYVYLPGKHHHQFTCTATCTFFDVIEGAFDIHYVDKDGKEIQPDLALKPAAKPAPTKSGPKK